MGKLKRKEYEDLLEPLEDQAAHPGALLPQQKRFVSDVLQADLFLAGQAVGGGQEGRASEGAGSPRGAGVAGGRRAAARVSGRWVWAVSRQAS